MSRIKDIREANKKLACVYITEKERVEELRLILEKEYGAPVSTEEAKEVGTSLLRLYKALSGGSVLTKAGLREGG